MFAARRLSIFRRCVALMNQERYLSNLPTWTVLDCHLFWVLTQGVCLSTWTLFLLRCLQIRLIDSRQMIIHHLRLWLTPIDLIGKGLLLSSFHCEYALVHALKIDGRNSLISLSSHLFILNWWELVGLLNVTSVPNLVYAFKFCRALYHRTNRLLLRVGLFGPGRSSSSWLFLSLWFCGYLLAS